MGRRVIECGDGLAAAFAGRLMALHGATVTRIEPPGGDALRRLGPFPDDTPAGPGGWSVFLNGGKHSVTLDLSTATGARCLGRLLAGADALIDDVTGPARKRMTGVCRDLSRLVVTSVSSLGADQPSQAPLPDLALEAAGGWMFAMGDPGREPLRPNGPLAWMTAGLYAAIATLHGLQAQQPLRADVSVLETVTATLIYDTVAFSYTGLERVRSGRRYSNALVTNTTVPCADGYVGLHVATQRQWQALCHWIGRPDLAVDERFRTPRARADNVEALDAELLPFFAARPAQELYHEGQAHHIPVSLIPTPMDVLASPQLAARHAWAELPYPGTARMVQIPGAPFRFDGHVPTIEPPHDLGMDTAATLGSIGVQPRDLARLAAAGVT